MTNELCGRIFFVNWIVSPPPSLRKNFRLEQRIKHLPGSMYSSCNRYITAVI